MRIMFGDREAYVEKHRTTARTRPIDSQKLGPDFSSLNTPNLYLTRKKF